MLVQVQPCAPSTSRIIMQLTFSDLLANITEALDDLDYDDLTKAHNEICGKKVRHLDYGVWEYTGEGAVG